MEVKFVFPAFWVSLSSIFLMSDLIFEIYLLPKNSFAICL